MMEVECAARYTTVRTTTIPVKRTTIIRPASYTPSVVLHTSVPTYYGYHAYVSGGTTHVSS